MKNPIHNALFIPAAFAILASALGAQTVETKSAYWHTIAGPSNRKAYVQPVLSGSISKENMRTSTSRANRLRYQAVGQFRCNAKLFFDKRQVISVAANGTVAEGVGASRMGYVADAPEYDYKRASLTLKLGGSVVYFGARRNSGPITSLEYTLTAFSAQQTFYVCYIPITLRGSVDAVLNTSLGTTLTLDPTGSSHMFGNSAIGLSGSGNGYIRATAAVMLGWSGFGAGFEAELRFLDTTITISVNGRTRGIDGMVEIRVQPLRLRLVVFAECGGRVDDTIYSWRMGYIWRCTANMR